MWMVSPKQHKDGFWRFCAESDEGGGFHEGCQHKHANGLEAQGCLEAHINLGRVTGMPDPDLHLAEIAYNAYCEQAQWKSLATGAPLPAWRLLSDAIQAGWLVAARAVKAKVKAAFLESLCGKDAV